jgi:molybdopterin molybdotransferase|uniref:Molybdopterin molybdenumtransferase n=1 Tax=Desulfobacca acetoxidans TaxID=60893 RepID=A0A7V6A417_9BACT
MPSLAFFRLKTRDEVLALYPRFSAVGVEDLDLGEAVGRVVAGDLAAGEDLPSFLRASMDGYAVRAADTFGATPGLPQYLEIRGAVPMGKKPEGVVAPGEAWRIATGGMIPDGADAVVMVEYTNETPEGTLEVRHPVAPGDNVLHPGEDVRGQEPLFPAGRRLRSQDIGLLAALGVTRLRVFLTPRVAVLSSGDEIVPVTKQPGPGQVRDANAFLAAAQVREGRGIPILKGIVPDNREALHAVLAEALTEADLVLISGGSSVGARDLTLKAVEDLPGAEILVHGVAIRPGKPTILADIGGKPLLGLPGHPASAAVVMHVLGQPLLQRLAGRAGKESSWGGTVQARLSRNLAGASGREDFVRVRLRSDNDTLWADPVLGPSGLLSPMVKSDGLVIIPLGVEGLFREDEVTVHLFSE